MLELMQQLVSDMYTYAGRSCVEVVLENGSMGKQINQAVNDCLTSYLHRHRVQQDLNDVRVAQSIRADLAPDMMRISNMLRKL